MPDFAWQFLHRTSQLATRTRLNLTVEGADHVPATGPVLIAARHVHHLHDGVALLSVIPRPMSIIVGLDWANSGLTGTAMRALCRSAHWPYINRTDPAQPVDPAESRQLLRAAMKETLTLLSDGRVVVIFPEAYPNIDPTSTPKQGPDDWLPFEPGVVRIAALAARSGIAAPIVPVGFTYAASNEREIAIRFGTPIQVDAAADVGRVLAEIEAAVRGLSQAAAD